MANFVLVHGAWVGGWCWRDIARGLRKQGHEVFTPTLTGLGERVHLMSPGINLQAHVTDILNVLRAEELSDVVLVGHSYGGMVIAGVADAFPDRIRSMVFLDAFVPENGQALVNLLPPGAPAPKPDGYVVPFFGAAMFGARPEVAAYVDARATPMPVACFIDPIKLTGGIDRVKAKTYVYCNVPAPTTFTPIYEKLKNNPAWRMRTLPCTHIVQIEMPNELTKLLLEVI